MYVRTIQDVIVEKERLAWSFLVTGLRGCPVRASGVHARNEVLPGAGHLAGYTGDIRRTSQV